MMRTARLCLSVLLASLAGVSPAAAQSTFGEIRGVVTDPAEAVIAAAVVSARNTATNEIRSTATDVNGLYAFINTPAGNWEVKIEKDRFRRFESLVELRAREVVRIDATLQIGELTSEVLVTAVVPTITTEVATITNTRSPSEVQALPVNFRAGSTNSVFRALSFAANVQTDSGGGNLSIGGGMPFMATSTVDGVSNINVRNSSIQTEMFPSADTIAEIKINSTANNAEFAQAGDITVTTRSGSNDFHGAVFWYHQNGAFDARDFFASRTPFKVANDFGATGTGRIWKDRTFFVGSYEALRFRNQRVVNTTVPPAPWRGGDFSSLLPATAILDPFSAGTGQAATPFPGNIIPSGRINASTKTLLDTLYQPQNVPGADVRNTNFRSQLGGGNDNDQYDARIDHIFGPKHNLYGRLSWKDIVQRTPLDQTVYQDRRDTFESWNIGITDNFVFQPNLINEFRFGFHFGKSLRTFGPNGTAFDGGALMKQAGVQGIRSDLPQGSQTPNVGIAGFMSTGQSREGAIRSRNLQFIDNVTWNRGRHTFKFGADIRRLGTTDITSFSTGDDLGDYTFDGTFSRNAVSDMLLGVPSFVFRANTGQDVDGVTYHTGLYAQDDFKVSPDLTLNFGVRYEIHPMFFDNARTTSNFDRAFPGPGARVIIADEEARKYTASAFRESIGNTPIVTASEAGLPATLRFTDYNNFAPRIGFAWKPLGNDKTVLRGGYGVFTVTILGSVFYTITGIHVSDTRTFPQELVNGVPARVFPAPFAGVGRPPVPDFRRGTQFDGQDPYMQQWHMTVERDLGAGIGARLTYTGNKSLKLFSSPDLNQVKVNTTGFQQSFASRSYPTWNVVYVRDPNTAAWYNGVTAEVNKRYSKGLLLQSSYTWAKHTTNATGADGTGFASENGSVPTDRYNLALDWGNVSSTRRHRWLTNFVYDLPTGSMTKNNSLLDAVAGGWQISGILLLQTGPYFTPTINAGTDPSGTRPANRSVNGRPDYAGSADGNLDAGTRTVAAWSDRSAFSVPRSNIGRFGYVGPNTLIGPPTANLSMKLLKRFRIVEQQFLQVEGSFTNLTNTPQFGIPARNIEAANFGRITSTQGAEQGGSRSIQVGLRYQF